MGREPVLTDERQAVLAALPHATSSILDGIADEFKAAVDDYLAAYSDPRSDGNGRCPNCETGSFIWGIAWGAGRCYQCGWPGRLYHVVPDLRLDPRLVCSATCNGHRVCGATRGEHVPREVLWHAEDGSTRAEIELRCPNPTPPPGLRLPFSSTWKPPEIARFTLLLWAHADFVEKRG